MSRLGGPSDSGVPDHRCLVRPDLRRNVGRLLPFPAADGRDRAAASTRRAGLSWFVGLVVGAFNLVIELLLKTSLAESMPGLADWQGYVPVPPVAALIVGFVLYLVLSLIGARSKLI